MKKFRLIIATAAAICIVAVSLVVVLVSQSAAADTAMQLDVAFVNDAGEPIEVIDGRNYVWLQVKTSNYNAIGDVVEQSYVNSISDVFAYIDIDTSVFSISPDNDGNAVVASPYMNNIAAAGGKLGATVCDGEFKGVAIGMDTASELGDYCITNAELAEYSGILMSVRLNVNKSAVENGTEYTAEIVESVENINKTSASLVTTGTITTAAAADLTFGAKAGITANMYDNYYTINSADNTQSYYNSEWSNADSETNIWSTYEPTDATVNTYADSYDWLTWGHGIARDWDSTNHAYVPHGKVYYDENIELGYFYTRADADSSTVAYHNMVSTAKYNMGNRFAFSFSAAYCSDMGADWSQSMSVGDLSIVLRYGASDTSNDPVVCIEYDGVELARSEARTTHTEWGCAPTKYTESDFNAIWGVLKDNHDSNDNGDNGDSIVNGGNGGIDLPIMPIIAKINYKAVDLDVTFENGVVTVYKLDGSVACTADLNDSSIAYDFSNARFKAQVLGLERAHAFAGFIDFECSWDNAISVQGASLTLDETISLNLYTDDVNGKYDQVYMKLDGESYESLDVVDADDNVVGYYMSYDKVTPRTMSDAVTAEFYGKTEGMSDTYLGSFQYSAEDYIYQMLNKTDTELIAMNVASDKLEEIRSLLIDTLYYSAAAQEYFEYNVDDLITEGLDVYPALKALSSNTAGQTSASPDELGVSYDLSLDAAANSVAKIKWMGAGLDFKDTVALRFKLRTAPKDLENVRVFVDGEETTDFSILIASGTVHYLYYWGTPPYEMKKPITITLYHGDTQVSAPITYSIQSYAYNAIRQYADDTALNALVTAMINYSDAAAAFNA